MIPPNKAYLFTQSPSVCRLTIICNRAEYRYLNQRIKKGHRNESGAAGKNVLTVLLARGGGQGASKQDEHVQRGD